MYLISITDIPDIVTSFSSFTNALQIPILSSKVINIPGSSTVTIVSHVISVAASGSLNPQTLCLSKSAFSKLKTHLYCGEFYGGLCVTDTSGSQSIVIMNGLVFEVVNGNSNGNNNVNISLMQCYLLWLSKTTGSSTASNDQLVALQARALYLAKLANESSHNASVPIYLFSIMKPTETL